MKKTRKSLAWLLSLCMVLSMLGGMSLTAFADGEAVTTPSTDTISALSTVTELTDDDKTMVDGAAEANAVQGFTTKTLTYENISFSGNELTFAIDFFVASDYTGNFKVYLNSAEEGADPIVDAVGVAGNSNGVAATQKSTFKLAYTPAAGTHTVILVGAANTANSEESAAENAAVAGFKSFSFGTGTSATSVFDAGQYMPHVWSDGLGNLGMSGSDGSWYAGIQGMTEGRTAQYDAINFTGNESHISVVVTTYCSQCWYFNADVYIDDATNEGNKIAELREIVTGAGWQSHGGFVKAALTKPISAGTHSVIFVGQNPTARVATEEMCEGHATLGWLSSLGAFKFIESKNATEEFIATEYSAASGVGTQDGMGYPNGASGLTGVSGLVNGNWVQYDNVVFTGQERAFSIDYSVATGAYQGNFNVYLDGIDSGKKILEVRNQDGSSNGWPSLGTFTFALEEPITGTHSVIIEGLANTELHTEAQWYAGAAGFYAFRFVNGDSSYSEFLAPDFDVWGQGTEGNGWDAPSWGEIWNETIEIRSGIRDGNWLQYNYVDFDGTEGRFSIDYSINSGESYGNFDVILVDNEGYETTILEARDVNTRSGWTNLVTMTFDLNQDITPGTYSVKLKGLPVRRLNEETEAWQGSSQLVAFSAFRFLAPAPEMTVSDPVVKLGEDTVDPWTNGFAAAGSYSVSVDIANGPDEAKLIAALYTADGRLIEANLSDASGNGTQTTAVAIPEGTALDGVTMKVFVWNATSLEPLYTK